MAVRTKGQTKGGRHFWQGVDPITGRRMYVSAATLSELESRVARIKHVRDGVRYGDISVHEANAQLRPAVGMSQKVADLWERYVRGLGRGSERVARSTWKNQLAPWFGEALVWDLSETRMRTWHTDLQRARRPGGKRGYAPKTIRLAFDLLLACVALAVRDGALSGVPWGQGFAVPNPKEPQRERESLRDPAELVALLSAAREWDLEHGRTYEGRFPVIAVLALTGLRQAEACGLAWEDLDLEREPHTIHVRHQARRDWHREGTRRPLDPPKGGRPREHILHPNVVAALLYQRRELRARGRYREDGPVFPVPGTSAWRTYGVVLAPRALREIVTRAGLPNVTAWTTHSMRHSFSRLELVGHGGDLRTVAERTGHRTLEQLEGYVRKAARGGGGSKIPELPHFLGPPALEASGAALEAPALNAGTVDTGPVNALAVVDGEPLEPRWPDLARVWLASAPHPGRKQPAEVTKAAKKNAARAYGAEFYRSHDRALAAAAGRRARRATLGAWAKAVSLARSAATGGPGLPIRERTE